MIDEPVYEYVRGIGWQITIGSYKFSEADCTDWIFIGRLLYPKRCKSYTILESCHELRVGDVIPYTFYVEIVTSIVGTNAIVDKLTKSKFYANSGQVGVNSSWVMVARPT